MKRMIKFGPDPIDKGGSPDNERRDPAYSKVRRNNHANDLRDVLKQEEEEEREAERRESREYYTDYEYDDLDSRKENGWNWRDLLSAKGRKRMETIEKAVAGIITGSKVIKSIKGMSRKQRMAAGAIIVAGIAGATYLALRKTKKRRIF